MKTNKPATPAVPAALPPAMPPAAVKVAEAVGVTRTGGGYKVGVFKWSDGKFGASVEVHYPFNDAESVNHTADKANALADDMLGQINNILCRRFGGGTNN